MSLHTSLRLSLRLFLRWLYDVLPQNKCQKKAAGEKEAKRRLAEAQNGNQVVGDAGQVPKVVEEERVSEREGDTNAVVTQTAANGGGAEETELL